MHTDTKRSAAELDRGLSIQGTNQRAVRDHNERLILTLLRNVGPKPKAEVARLVGVSPQTAAVIMRSLEHRGLIERCSPLRGKVGQPSIPMRLATNGAFFFGLKIGRRSQDLVVCDFLGQIISQLHSTHEYPTPDAAVAFARRGVAEITNNLPMGQRPRIAGLGIASPSYLWEWTDIIGVPSEKMASWKVRDIRSEIDAHLDMPVYCQNDSSCACDAELVFGDQNRPATFLHIFVGYFVGGGIVLDNNLICGPTGNAAALGTMPVPIRGNMARQLVEVASLGSLEKMAKEAGSDFSAIWERSLDWNLDQAILQKWLTQAADGIARAVVSACSIIDFELVIIDGWLPADVRRELVSQTEKKLSSLNLTGLVRPTIREGSIGPDARAIGAAALPLASKFLISRNATSSTSHSFPSFA